MQAKSCDSCTEADTSIANPVWRAAITSEWSQKMLSAWLAMVRAATCRQNDVSSPAILYRFGTIRSRPCDAVNVVASAPAWSAPCTAPAAPPSDCISETAGTVCQMFGWERVAHSSLSSPIGEAGVIG